MSDQQDKDPNSAIAEPKEHEEEKSSPIEPEILKNLPPDVRKAVEFSLQAFSGPVFHPITKKITEAHIDKLLDQTEKDSEREFRDTQSSRKYGFGAFLVICALFVFITIYLTHIDKDLYRDVFKVLVGLVGGFGGGFAFKGYLDRDKD